MHPRKHSRNAGVGCQPTPNPGEQGGGVQPPEASRPASNPGTR